MKAEYSSRDIMLTFHETVITRVLHSFLVVALQGGHKGARGVPDSINQIGFRDEGLD